MAVAESLDRIAGFLTGKRLLITGSTGFLGQPLVEKILWAAPEVERIWVLIRPKRRFGGDLEPPEERLQKELFSSSVFDRLRYRHGEGLQAFLEERVVAVGGDISEDGLGIEPGLRDELQRTLDVVINSAAVVAFDAPIDDALELNTMGAGRVADFAAGCDHALLLHVSTAYVCGATNETIPEIIHHDGDPSAGEPFPPRRFADPALDIEHIRALIRRVEEEGHGPEVRRELVHSFVQRRQGRGADRSEPRRDMIQNLRGRWIKNRLVEEGMAWARQRGWNDTYTYTKALGEQVVLARRGHPPTAIVRPAIIESSLAEPSPGWLDGLRMADPLIAAIGKGRLRSLPLDPDVTLDLVPVDMVVNAMLAALPRLAEDGGLAVYQVATGARNAAKMGHLHNLIVRYFQANPMFDRRGEPIRVKPLSFPPPPVFRFQHRLKSVPLTQAENALEWLIERGIAAATLSRTRRRIAAARAALDKLYYYGELYEPYLNLDCRFLVDETMRLYEWLSPDDRRRFNFDVSRINWRHYMQVHIAGVKKHILKIERAGTLEVDDEDAARQASVSTIFDLLEATARRLPDGIALQMKRDEEWQTMTFAELREAALAIGDGLLRLGLRKGDRVVLWSENQPAWGAAYMGATSVGLIVVPLDAQTWHREVWSTARFTEARAILASSGCFAEFTAEELAVNERERHSIPLLDVEDGCRPFDRDEYPRSTRPPLAAEPVPRPEVDSDDPASIIFTTGTAVDPRGAVHTHQNFLSNLFGISRVLSVSEQDRFLSVLPLYHALEFTCGFLAPIHHGGTVTYARSLKPRVILEAMRETGTTIMLGVPTLYALIREDLERRVLGVGKSPIRSNLMETTKQISRSWERTFSRSIGRQIFSRVHQEMGGGIRFFVSGGSALGRELYQDYQAMGLTIYEGYGLTETAPVLTVNPLYQSRAGSCGKPLPGVELRLWHTDSDGVGEIIVQSPSLMNGYFKNPGATERVIIDGWFHTGDLGWVDADGYLYITGRIKDVIVTGGGKNVYPIDLEAIYRAIPAVREICVVGVPSGLTEEVHAVVVPERNAVEEAGDLAEVRKLVQRDIQALARELPSYHRVQQLHVWGEPLPRNRSGEIDRAAVRERVRKGIRAPTPAPAEGGRERLADAIGRELARLSGFPAGEIRLDRDLYDDLGLDSLKAIELFLVLEHELGIPLDDDEASRVRTVEELLAAAGVPSRARARPPAARRPEIRSALPFDERSVLDRWLFESAVLGLETLYGSYFDLTIELPEHLPRKSPYLLAANHSSHLDAPAILSAVRRIRGSGAARAIHVLGARDYFFDTALKRWFFSTFLNVVPIEREEASLAGLRMVKSILAGGESALIFPEGTRSRSGGIQPFKPGLGLLAWELGVPIVPVRISGTHDALPAGRTLPKRGKVTVTFGTPVTMDSYREAGESLPHDILYRTIASDVRKTIIELGNGAATGGMETEPPAGEREAAGPAA